MAAEQTQNCPHPKDPGATMRPWGQYVVDPTELKARAGAVMVEAEIAGAPSRLLVIEGQVVAAGPASLPPWMLVNAWCLNCLLSAFAARFGGVES